MGRLKSEIYVVNKNRDIIEEVIVQLKNVKVGETIPLDIKQLKDDKKTAPLKNTKAIQFINFVKHHKPDQYRKKVVYELLGWKDDKHISDFLRRNPEVQAMRDAGLVDWDHHHIIIHPRAVAK